MLPPWFHICDQLNPLSLFTVFVSTTTFALFYRCIISSRFTDGTQRSSVAARRCRSCALSFWYLRLWFGLAFINGCRCWSLRSDQTRADFDVFIWFHLSRVQGPSTRAKSKAFRLNGRAVRPTGTLIRSYSVASVIRQLSSVDGYCNLISMCLFLRYRLFSYRN